MTGAQKTIRNVGQPGKTYRVDAAKYDAMLRVMLAVLPQGPPGVTVAALNELVRPQLPDDLFPGGATCGWWVKAVQLDQEAEGVIARSKTSPLQLYRV